MTTSTGGGSKYFAHFEIDIISALSLQLTSALDALAIGALEPSILRELPPLQGVYKLFHKQRLVYVGKAGNLPKRLTEHWAKISGRQNISVELMGFKCLSVHQNWTALAPEASLIAHYRAQSNNQCEWNGNGFGPHDPGRNREITNKAPDGFDMRHPIRADWKCDWVTAGKWSLLDLLISLKQNLPFLLRYETDHLGEKKYAHYTRGHQDFCEKTVHVPRDAMTAEELLEIISSNLPGWQATVFPSHLILYKESKDYIHGRRIVRMRPAQTPLPLPMA